MIPANGNNTDQISAEPQKIVEGMRPNWPARDETTGKKYLETRLPPSQPISHEYPDTQKLLVENV